jgi:hypothetical protein
MSERYRSSRFIDFNEGRVILDPESFLKRTTMPSHTWPLDQKIDFFECRVEVWQLGVAVEMLKQIEANAPPSIWSHAAYGLLSVIASYFEMIGKILNAASASRNTSGSDFNCGFCNVYPGLLADPSGDYQDEAVPQVKELRDLMRNGMYHLGFPKKNFLIHNSPQIRADFQALVVQEVTGRVFLMNPHRVTRTLVNHFGKFITGLRQSSAAVLRKKFEEFFDRYGT